MPPRTLTSHISLFFLLSCFSNPVIFSTRAPEILITHYENNSTSNHQHISYTLDNPKFFFLFYLLASFSQKELCLIICHLILYPMDHIKTYYNTVSLQNIRTNPPQHPGDQYGSTKGDGLKKKPLYIQLLCNVGPQTAVSLTFSPPHKYIINESHIPVSLKTPVKTTVVRPSHSDTTSYICSVLLYSLIIQSLLHSHMTTLPC